MYVFNVNEPVAWQFEFTAAIVVDSEMKRERRRERERHVKRANGDAEFYLIWKFSILLNESLTNVKMQKKKYNLYFSIVVHLVGILFFIHIFVR